MNGLRKFVVAALVLTSLPALAQAQQPTTITGRVTAESGQPLSGATVFLEGTSVGSTTDENGRYSFQVPGARVSGQSARLTARRIGYTANSASVTSGIGTASAGTDTLPFRQEPRVRDLLDRFNLLAEPSRSGRTPARRDRPAGTSRC